MLAFKKETKMIKEHTFTKQLFGILLVAGILALLLATPLLAAEEDDDGGVMNYLPFIIAAVIYFISVKFKPKKPKQPEPKKKVSSQGFESTRQPGTANRAYMQDFKAPQQSYERKYKPIEPK